MNPNVINKLLLDELLESEVELSSCSDTTDSSDGDSLMNVLFFAVSNDTKGTCLKQIIASCNDDEFKNHFRINRALFRELLQLFSESNECKRVKIRKTYSTEMQLAIFLWFVGRENCTFQDIAKEFGFPLDIVSKAIHNALHFLSGLSQKYIRWSTEEESIQTEVFMKNKIAIQGVLGVLGCTRVRTEVEAFIDTTTNISSVCLQGICNEKMKFMDISVGLPGYVHNNRVFQKSHIYERLPTLCRNGFILGDGTYAQCRNLITPYRDDGHLTPIQMKFNQRLNSSRFLIDESFELLQRRFKQLKHCNLKDAEDVGHFVRACVVLHNLCTDDELPLDCGVASPPSSIQEIEHVNCDQM